MRDNIFRNFFPVVGATAATIYGCGLLAWLVTMPLTGCKIPHITRAMVWPVYAIMPETYHEWERDLASRVCYK